MMFNCPVCGRLKCSYWPEHWVFRRGDTFYCSETCYCIDLFRDMNLIKQVELERRQRKVGKLTLEIKKKAVQTAIDGGDPIKYLADCGYTAPDKMWCYIKAQLKEKDPETFAKIPDRRKVKKAEIPEPVSGGEWEKVETPEDPVKLTGPIKIEEVPAEPEKVDLLEASEKISCMPEKYIGYKVRAIEGEFGIFTYVKRQDMLYMETMDGDEIGMSPVQWRIFLKKMPEVMQILGAVET